MQSAGAIRDADEIASAEGRTCEEIEHQAIDRATLALHEVIDQRVVSRPIRMQEAAGQISTFPQHSRAPAGKTSDPLPCAAAQGQSFLMIEAPDTLVAD